MKFGKLEFTSIDLHPALMAKSSKWAINTYNLDALVSKIDGKLADTVAFCEAYDIGLDVSANCVIVEARRGDRTWHAACIILATTRADVNGVVRKHLDARKISFASMDAAIALTGMEYGGITPVGLPADWSILVDTAVMAKDRVIIGSGIRGSKLLIATSSFRSLPNATIMDIAKPAN